MKLIQSSTQHYFDIIYKGKTYYVDYLISDGPIGNRNNWQFLYENWNKIEDKKIKSKLLRFCKRGNC